MPWSLLWSKDAVDGLAEVWLNSDDRAVLSAAIRSAESQLQKDPVGATNELHEGLRTIDAAEMRLYVEIDEPANIVRVVNIGQTWP